MGLYDRKRPPGGLDGTGIPNWWKCRDCDAAGAFSESAHGSERWYCAEHFPGFKGWGTARQVGDLIPPSLRAARDRLTPKPYDFEAEAERLALQQTDV